MIKFALFIALSACISSCSNQRFDNFLRLISNYSYKSEYNFDILLYLTHLICNI